MLSLALTLLAATPAVQTVVVDGIAAIVNQEVISIGEVRRAANLQRDSELGQLTAACGSPVASVQNTPIGSAAGAEPAPAAAAPVPSDQLEESALECLIDRTLIFREVRRFPQLDVTAADVDAVYAELEASSAGVQSFEAQLKRYGLTPELVREDLRRQMLITNYIDSRFRATVDISIDQARQYWESTLAPDMRQRGIEIPAFETVDEEFVIPILREQEVNRRVQSWISDLRQRATIVRKYQ